jgi:hypothetical protein
LPTLAEYYLLGCENITDVSDEHTVSIFRVEKDSKKKDDKQKSKFIFRLNLLAEKKSVSNCQIKGGPKGVSWE